MFVDDYYKFKVAVSIGNYWNKEDVNACIGSSKNATNKQIRLKYGRSSKSKISFREVEVTASEFLDYCIHGYTFCNLFRGYPDSGQTDKGKTVSYRKKDGSFTMSAKCDKFFYGSNVICADIEETAYQSIQDYIDRISIKPTFWYSTFSHMQPSKGVRFRMVYVLDEPIIGKEQFEAIVDAFNHRIENEVCEEMHDKCNKKPAQYFNGTNVANGELCIEYDGSGCIYSINDIINVNNIIIEREEDNKITTNYPSWQNDNTSIIPSPNDWLLHDIDTMTYDAFMQAHRHQYNYCYRGDNGVWVNDTYQIVDDNYFKLPHWVYTTTDGSNRRIKVFLRMCLRRVMCPTIDIDNLIFCAYEDVHRYFDNSDGVFNSDYYKRNAMDAFAYTLDELEENCSKSLEILRAKRPKSGIILKSGTAYGGFANAAIRDIKYDFLDLYYNRDLSVMDNLAVLQSMLNFPISERTLYRYCHERGITLGRLSDDDIMANLDVSLSIRKNKELLAGMGINVGEKRIIRLLNTLREQQPRIIPEQPLSASDLGSTTTDTTSNEWSGQFWGTAYSSPFGF